MAMDGLNLAASAAEIAALAGGKIEKIAQPEKDELVLTVRSEGKSRMLLLSASAVHCRAQITEQKRENPMEAPMFCMLLRRRLSGGRILSVDQPMLDRVLRVSVAAVNELGDPVAYTLAAELMGKYSNIILINEKNVIIDAMRHVGVGMSSVRLVLPGLAYELPPPQDKCDPREATADDFYTVLEAAGDRRDKAMSGAFFGLSPAMAATLLASSKTDSLRAQAEALAGFYSRLAKGETEPSIAYDGSGRPIGVYPFMPDLEYAQRAQSMGKALDTYYEEYDRAEKLKRRGASIRKILQNNIDRCNRKAALYEDALCADAELAKWRGKGELIMANLHNIRPGMSEAALTDYYCDPPQTVIVTLDPRLAPTANAERCFKKYQKLKAGRDMAAQQKAETLSELDYLEGQMDNLEKCTTYAELAELAEELGREGYIRRDKNAKKVQKQPPSRPLCYISSDGLEIYVGKNNRQNDELTLKLAGAEDYWLHVKNMPGSHVIIKSGGEPPNGTLEEAALLAAWYSRARGSANVAVDYTPKKYVKKPGGAKPGMVIYTTNKTAFVTPDEAKVRNLQQRK